MLHIPNFADDLCEAIRKKNSILCCGLDPQLRYMPPHMIKKAVKRYGRTFQTVGWLFTEFNCKIIDAVYDLVVCVKPQMAFYEAYGAAGITSFRDTVAYAKKKGLLVIGDVKRGDGGDTADAYADTYLGEVPFFGMNDPAVIGWHESRLRVDCATVNGYIGEDCVGRFVKVAKDFGTGIFVVAKTSFKPNSEIEQLQIPKTSLYSRYVWEEMAYLVREWGEGTEGSWGMRNIGVVMGATYPEDAIKMREILPDSFFLIPGFGGQGASADDAVVGVMDNGLGGIVNNSRNLIYAWQNWKGKYQCKSEDFVMAARRQAIDDRDALNEACKRAGKLV